MLDMRRDHSALPSCCPICQGGCTIWNSVPSCFVKYCAQVRLYVLRLDPDVRRASAPHDCREMQQAVSILQLLFIGYVRVSCSLWPSRLRTRRLLFRSGSRKETQHTNFAFLRKQLISLSRRMRGSGLASYYDRSNRAVHVYCACMQRKHC